MKIIDDPQSVDPQVPPLAFGACASWMPETHSINDDPLQHTHRRRSPTSCAPPPWTAAPSSPPSSASRPLCFSGPVSPIRRSMQLSFVSHTNRLLTTHSTRPTVLLCLQTDKRIHIPWTAIWTPLWCLDAVLLFMLWFLVALGRNKPPEGLEEEVSGRLLIAGASVREETGRTQAPTTLAVVCLNQRYLINLNDPTITTVEGRPPPAAAGRGAVLLQRALPSLPHGQARRDGALEVVRA